MSTILMAGGGGAAARPEEAFLASLGNAANLECAWLPSYLASYTTNTPHSLRNAVAAPASGVAANEHDLFLSKDFGASQPTYNGTPGDASGDEYFSFDGADVIRNLATPPAFIESIHKDSASWSMIFAYHHTAGGGATQTIFATTNASFYHGIHVRVGKVGYNGFEFLVRNGSGNTMSTDFGASNWSAGWNIGGISIDEAAGTGHILMNAVTESFTSTYSSPSSTDSGLVSIGGYGADPANSPLLSGRRIGDIVFWNAAIGSTGLEAASTVLRTKYGI